jgi:hypothetical protein
MSDNPIDVTVTGSDTAITGRAYGVDPRDGDAGIGVNGINDVGNGVQGNSISGRGVYGYAEQNVGVEGFCVNGDGVRGSTNSSAHAGISAINDHGGFAVWARGGSHFENSGAGAIWAVTTQEFSSCIGAEAKNGVAIDATSAGCAVRGVSSGNEGVHGESRSGTWAGVTGVQTGTGPGVWGISQQGEGVHGESNSANWAAVAAINKGGGPGLWAQGAIAGHFQGDVEVTGDIRLLGQDCAEDFEVGGVDEIEPGSVVVIDEGGVLRISKQAYDKRVAGVISGALDLRPAIIMGRKSAHHHRQPVALFGKVYCKASATYSPIAIGDLLTSSNTLGHAMKATSPRRAFGSVIGKALEPLSRGQGMIRILVALQ